MAERKKDRRKEILSAALQEFTEKGYDGARLQAIADNIGVTKAMIHYYFNTKEGLFRAVFSEACEKVLGGLPKILESGDDLFPKIELFISETIDRLREEPSLAGFLVCELNRNRETVIEMLRKELEFDSGRLNRQLEEAASNYEIAAVSSRQLLMNIWSLCMFPYAGRVFTEEVAGGGETPYEELLKSQKGVVTDTIFNWLSS